MRAPGRIPRRAEEIPRRCGHEDARVVEGAEARRRNSVSEIVVLGQSGQLFESVATLLTPAIAVGERVLGVPAAVAARPMEG